MKPGDFTILRDDLYGPVCLVSL